MADSSCERDPFPFFHDYRVEYEGGPDTNGNFNQCKKNPGHPTFIPVTEFKKENLPEGWRTDDVVDMVKERCHRTVRVVVTEYLSDNDISTRHGTGYMDTNVRVTKKACPCPECITHGDPKREYLTADIITARHVVSDTSEAERTTVEFGYDSSDRNTVITFYGVRVENTRLDKDMSEFMCVNHNMELYKKLMQKGSEYWTYCFPIMVSHPHGVSKRISLGKNLYSVCKVEIPTDSDEPFTFKVKPGRKCRLSQNHQATSLESFQELVESETQCQPGVRFRIRDGMEMSCNPSTCRLYQNDQCKHRIDMPFLGRQGFAMYTTYFGTVTGYDKYYEFGKFVKFPSDVEFVFANGNDSKSFPEVEFEVDDKEYESLAGKTVEGHYEYDIETCPGSSGAFIYGRWQEFPHGGSDKVNGIGKTGRSNLVDETNFDRFDEQQLFSTAILIGFLLLILVLLTIIDSLFTMSEPSINQSTMVPPYINQSN